MERKARYLPTLLSVSIFDPNLKFEFEWETLLPQLTKQIEIIRKRQHAIELWSRSLPDLIIVPFDQLAEVDSIISDLMDSEGDTKPGLFTFADILDDETCAKLDYTEIIDAATYNTSLNRLKKQLHRGVELVELRKRVENANERLEKAIYYQHTLSHISIALNAMEDFSRDIENLMDVLLFTLDLDMVLIHRLQMCHDDVRVSDFIFRTRDHVSQSLQSMDMTNVGRMLQSIEPDNQIVLQRSATTVREIEFAMDSLQVNMVNICPLQTRHCLLGSILYATRDERNWDTEMNDLLLTISSLIANAWEKDMTVFQKIETQGRLTESVRMVEQASKMASLGIMSAGITHEINQPLSAIKVTAESIELWSNNNPDELPEKFVKRIGIIHKSANRIDEIIRHMRSNWISATPTDSIRINVNEGIKQGLTLLERQLKSHGIELFLQFNQAEISISGVKIQFEQIIVNLIVNAIHALDDVDREKKILTISTEKADNKAIITVEDNGTGFTPEVLMHMFEPFYTTKKAGKGSGLGLAIVKNFVSKFNGEISAGNVPEGGAKFVIKLPCTQ